MLPTSPWEYVEGTSIQRLITLEGPIAQKRALSIALEVARALNYAWTKLRLVHRDIKPANILLDTDKSIKVADLGLVLQKSPRGNTPSPTHIEGTPHFMSPEQARGSGDLDSRSDIYSLGCTLYHMVTGVMPFQDSGLEQVLQNQISGHVPHIRDVNPKVTMATANVIQKMMIKDPALRYEDWPALIADLQKAIGGRMVVLNEAEKGASTMALVGGAPVAPAMATLAGQTGGAAPAAAGDRADKPARKKKGPPLKVGVLIWPLIFVFWAALAWSVFIPPEPTKDADIPRRSRTQPDPGPPDGQCPHIQPGSHDFVSEHHHTAHR